MTCDCMGRVSTRLVLHRPSDAIKQTVPLGAHASECYISDLASRRTVCSSGIPMRLSSLGGDAREWFHTVIGNSPRLLSVSYRRQ